MTDSVDSVQRHLSTPIPTTLWHYTSLQGFKGIVDSKLLWATDLQYLNDAGEYSHGVGMVRKLLKEQTESSVVGVASRTLCSALVDFLSRVEMQVFVACFSEKRDQLGQWRGYTSGGCGISIGFNLLNLRPTNGENTLTCFAPCVYDDEQKKHLLKAALDEISAEITQMSKEVENAYANGDLSSEAEAELSHDWETRLNDAIGRSGAKLLRVAALTKHHTFREENEWRFVFPAHTDIISSARKFRVGSSSLIPYFELPLALNPQGGLALKEVIVGPTKERALASHAVESFLNCSGATCETISSTETPFRFW